MAKGNVLKIILQIITGKAEQYIVEITASNK